MDMVNIRYGSRPYTYRKEYGRSCIRLTALSGLVGRLSRIPPHDVEIALCYRALSKFKLRSTSPPIGGLSPHLRVVTIKLSILAWYYSITLFRNPVHI